MLKILGVILSPKQVGSADILNQTIQLISADIWDNQQTTNVTPILHVKVLILDE